MLTRNQATRRGSSKRSDSRGCESKMDETFDSAADDLELGDSTVLAGAPLDEGMSQGVQGCTSVPEGVATDNGGVSAVPGPDDLIATPAVRFIVPKAISCSSSVTTASWKKKRELQRRMEKEKRDAELARKRVKIQSDMELQLQMLDIEDQEAKRLAALQKKLDECDGSDDESCASEDEFVPVAEPHPKSTSNWVKSQNTQNPRTEAALTEDGLELLRQFNDLKGTQPEHCTIMKPSFTMKSVQPIPSRPVAKMGSVETYIARNTIGMKLPAFSGDPQEWPMFFQQYRETTEMCGLGDRENMQRLQEALKGKAREMVKPILGFTQNLDQVIKTLQRSFGRPAQIIEALIASVRAVPNLRDARFEELMTFSNMVNNMVVTVNRMNCEYYLNNPILLNELVLKMPSSLKDSWSDTMVTLNKDHFNLEDFSTWLERKATASSLLPQVPRTTPNESSKKDGRKQTAAILSAVDDADSAELKKGIRKKECPCCLREGHPLFRCKTFEKLTVSERWDLVMKNRLCFVCFNVGHRVGDCPSKVSCNISGCDKKHNTLLHTHKVSVEKASEKPKAVDYANTAVNQKTREVLLKVLPVVLISGCKEVSTYAMLDEGATVTIMNDRLANELGLGGEEEDFTVTGFGNIPITSKSKRVNVTIMSDDRKEEHQLSNVRTVKNLTLPTQRVKGGIRKHWHHFEGIDLPSGYLKPEILIGQDHAGLIITREVREGPPNAPLASKTKLGWVVHGHYSGAPLESVMFCSERSSSDEDLHQLVKSYFTAEAVPVTSLPEISRSREDNRAELMMDESSKRVDGRWEMALPWRDADVKLPESRSMALKRLWSVEKKLDRDPVLAGAYSKKINDMISKGFIRRVSNVDDEASSKLWYLPHFAVINPNKPGKIRVVWDAAAKSNGMSLNDNLLTGPDYYNALPGVLCKFRQRAIGIAGDIEEMFPQIAICDEDCRAQRFLWRGGNRDEKPATYEFRRMIFGAVSSPSQAQYIKNRNAQEMASIYPKAVDAIVYRHYMDDYVDSLDNVEETKQQIREVSLVHKTGGFNIRNWISSHPSALEDLPQEAIGGGMRDFEEEGQYPVERVLGLRWNPNSDNFQFDVKFHRVSEDILMNQRRPTKREVLRVLMSIFDPLGFLSHFHVKGKILLQSIWKSGIGWDDTLENEDYKLWTAWLTQMALIADVQIPRFYGFNPKSKLQLHVFCDASQVAYSAVAYLRSEEDGVVRVQLVLSKTRVAPLKQMTIPRLELQAAVLGSKVADAVRKYHDLSIASTFMWSDSITVLRWIKSEASRFKTFVAQRLGEILELTDVSQWRWVPTKMNVADDATREEDDADLSASSRWFHGPEFLHLDISSWPEDKTKMVFDPIAAAELVEFVIVMGTFTMDLPDAARFSSWLKLVRTTAWMLRFVFNSRSITKRTGELTQSEFDAAEVMWCKFVQWSCYPDEIRTLTEDGTVKSTSSIYKLSPRLRHDGLMCMDSRIDGGCVGPVILSRSHRYSELLIGYYHCQFMHVGQEAVVNDVRKRFWIPALRSLVKAVSFRCQRCNVIRAKPTNPRMGLLPMERLTPYVKPFYFTGMDYFGPVSVKVKKNYEKRYGVLFTCLTTRAVHVEMANSLNTDSALLAIRRFIALRGTVSSIWSDNGKNLVGADRELKSTVETIDQNMMTRELLSKSIEWKFIPPATPHMGGSWERMVQAVKKALRAVLCQRVLGQEALQTFFAEAAHTVNSRPLTFVSSDPNDPRSITPNDLLCGSGTNVPGPMYLDGQKLQRQWMLSQKCADLFWKRWIKEYRPTLIQRQKWLKEGRSLQVDDHVIIVDEALPRNSWPRGRIVKVYPGRDGVVRVVDVKTLTGTYRRPVRKLCLVDLSSDSKDIM